MSDRETYWLDEKDPAELERRAQQFEASAHFGLAEQLRDRAALVRAALAIVKATPSGQKTFIVAKDGKPFANENQLGKVVSLWRDKLKLRKVLRLYDARGTAATRLLQAGADIREIAVHMGWSIKRAAEVIENYVALSPEMALRIEKAFGVSMDTLMRMQNSYDIAQTRKRAGEINVTRFSEELRNTGHQPQ